MRAKILIALMLIVSLAACSKGDDPTSPVSTVSGSGQSSTKPTPPAAPTPPDSPFPAAPGPGTTTTPGQGNPSTSHSSYGDYAGRGNGDRPTWRWSAPMSAFPKVFYLTVSGCIAKKKISNNGGRYQEGELVVKQSDVHPGMAVVAPSSCQSTTAYVEY